MILLFGIFCTLLMFASKLAWYWNIIPAVIGFIVQLTIWTEGALIGVFFEGLGEILGGIFD